MSRLEQFRETLATYRKHGWRLARVLMRPATLSELRAAMTTHDDDGDVAAGGDVASDKEVMSGGEVFERVAVREAQVDAMWFARPAQGGREAWELRHVSESPYALFELFEADEAEEDREDVRRELEARMDAKVNAADERWNAEDEI